MNAVETNTAVQTEAQTQERRVAVYSAPDGKALIAALKACGHVIGKSPIFGYGTIVLSTRDGSKDIIIRAAGTKPQAGLSLLLRSDNRAEGALTIPVDYKALLGAISAKGAVQITLVRRGESRGTLEIAQGGGIARVPVLVEPDWYTNPAYTDSDLALPADAIRGLGCVQGLAGIAKLVVEAAGKADERPDFQQIHILLEDSGYAYIETADGYRADRRTAVMTDGIPGTHAYIPAVLAPVLASLGTRDMLWLYSYGSALRVGGMDGTLVISDQSFKFADFTKVIRPPDGDACIELDPGTIIDALTALRPVARDHQGFVSLDCAQAPAPATGGTMYLCVGERGKAPVAERYLPYHCETGVPGDKLWFSADYLLHAVRAVADAAPRGEPIYLYLPKSGNGAAVLRARQGSDQDVALVMPIIYSK